ncbi:MAG: bifunctional phosphoglucose/phosphomannose isomerase [Chloroflexi bacterium]|nr:MAG: bifunctional phosphoglucose/phosphomannose isomerase [Chloroflexota bacterium]
MTAGRHPVLDDSAESRRLDPSGMLEAVYGLPDQCREAWEAARAFELPWKEAPRQIVILGMGGSAIAGDYFRALLSLESPVPVFNVRAYDLPSFVDEETLVIASSFSGDTEETLSAFEQALATPAKKLALTTGGPRAAIGWGLMPLLAIAEKLGLMQGVEGDVEEAIAVLRSLREEYGAEVDSSQNPAKQLALQLHERLPVVYGAGPLIEVARRWKTQLNESATVWAFFEEMPEAQHNAIVGWGLPATIAKATTVVLLRSGRLDQRRVALRYDLMRQLMADTAVDIVEVASRGESALAQMLSLTLLGDFAAAYLALLYGIDPTPTTVIDELKALLAKAGRPAPS